MHLPRVAHGVGESAAGRRGRLRQHFGVVDGHAGSIYAACVAGKTGPQFRGPSRYAMELFSVAGGA